MVSCLQLVMTGILAPHPDTYLALDYFNYDQYDKCFNGGVIPDVADVVAQGEMPTRDIHRIL